MQIHTYQRPEWFRCSFNNVETTSKQCQYKVVSTLCNVVLMLFQSQASTLYKRYSTSKIRNWILFQIQCWISVISTLAGYTEGNNYHIGILDNLFECQQPHQQIRINKKKPPLPQLKNCSLKRSNYWKLTHHSLTCLEYETNITVVLLLL